MNDSLDPAIPVYAGECQHVYQAYPDKKGGRRIILNDINLRVRPGTFLSLVGPSGSGKSTFLRLILGSESPYRGIVRINGKPVPPPDRDRGIVFQSYSLFPQLTVIENIMFGMELEEVAFVAKFILPVRYLRKKKRWRAQAMEYLDRVNLTEHADKYPYELSGGMRQRVAIAQAMIMKPAILLMDEPFGALDPDTRESLQHFLLEIHQKTQMTVLFITHDLLEALYLCTRLIVLSPYYTVAEGPAQGSKIVVDIAYPGSGQKSVDDKYSREFNEKLRLVREKGFDSVHRQPIDQFVLEHPDSLPARDATSLP